MKIRFGKSVRRSRLSQGLNAKQLAHLARISPSYLADIEKGTRFPSYDVAMNLIYALKLECKDRIWETMLKQDLWERYEEKREYR